MLKRSIFDVLAVAVAISLLFIGVNSSAMQKLELTNLDLHTSEQATTLPSSMSQDSNSNRLRNLGQALPTNHSMRFRWKREQRPRFQSPPTGSLLTFDGKVVPKQNGGVSFVPGSELRTPSISNQPQFGSYRGDLPPLIPHNVPHDLPQFQRQNSQRNIQPPAIPSN